MHAVTWQGKGNVEVREVPLPRIDQPTDAIVKVTSAAICGSDLHLYGPMAPFMRCGEILGHESMGIVEEIGSEVTQLQPGDRVVIPFNISCGDCWMCRRGLQSQCETTQVREQGTGAALFGYSQMYGAVPGGQADFVRVPHANYGPVKVPAEGPDERYLYLSDILPTAWQAARYAGVEEGSSVVVLGLGPVGQLAARSARLQGAEQVIGVERVGERIRVAASFGATVVDLNATSNVAEAVFDLTQGRGADAAIDAVGMEAHGNPISAGIVGLASSLPGPVGRFASSQVGIDRLAALHTAIEVVRRGGTVSLSGVYGGAIDPMPMLRMFDKQLTIKMGQANVRRWTDELLQLVDQHPAELDLEGLASHRLPLTDAPRAYRMFRDKTDNCLKVVLKPGATS